MMWILLLCSAFVSIFVSPRAFVTESYSLDNEIINVVVGSAGEVIISTSGGELLSLNSEISDVIARIATNDIIVKGGLVVDKQFGLTIACLSNQTCIMFSSSNSINYQDLFLPGNSALILSYRSSLYIGSYSNATFSSGMLLVNQGYKSASGVYRQSLYLTKEGFSRQFLSVFSYDVYIYFIVVDTKANKKDIRILRVCEETNISATSFTSLYEAQLMDISGAYFVQGELVTNSLDQPYIVISTNKEGNGFVSMLSLFHLNDQMDASYQKCVSGTMPIPMPWSCPMKHERCYQFGPQTKVEMCNFNPLSSQVHSLYTKNAGPFFPVLDVAGQLTATLTINYQARNYIYLAFSNSSGNFIAKHLIPLQVVMNTSLLHIMTMPSSVNHLLWNKQLEIIYATTLHTIYKFPLDECFFKTTCSDCLSLSNSLCGWCVLSATCTMEDHCVNYQLKGRWIDQSNLCPAITIHRTISSFDLIVKISNYTFPQLSFNESYTCILEDVTANVSIETFMNNNSCWLIGVFTNQVLLNVTISIKSSVSLTPFVVSTTTLTLVNCSAKVCCSDCISYEVCRWIQGTCVERTTQISNEFDIAACPMARLPKSGILELPVTINTILEVVFSNILQLNDDNNHVCKVVYEQQLLQGQGVLNIPNSSIACNFSSGQIKVIDEPLLANLYIESYHSCPVQVYNTTNNALPILLFNCTELTCLSCIYQLQSGCGWCNGECVTAMECNTGMFITEISYCPHPVISSISPTAGPTQGGTIITIYGSEIGHDINDIIHIVIGQNLCEPISASYISGEQISCVTSPAVMDGDFQVLINISRGYELFTVSLSPLTYHYKSPSIYGISPSKGPKAGGTLIQVSGQYLDIGVILNTKVLIAGDPCIIKKISNNSIDCITSPSDSIGNVSVEIIIDNLLETRVYTFTANPLINFIHPSTIIPAGGITILFFGKYLNSVENPLLIIRCNNLTKSSMCTSYNETVIHCISPSLQDTECNINYDIILDGAPGPDTSQSALILTLSPNPNFTRVFSTHDIDYTTIIIVGSYINSVIKEEISVFVGEQMCPLVEISEKNISCRLSALPTDEQKVTAHVVVIIGNGSLTYDVGQIEFISKENENNTFSYIPITVVALILIMAIVVLIIAAVGAVYWKRRHPPLRNLTKRSNTRHDKGSDNTSTQPSNEYFHVFERSLDFEENVYESITDYNRQEISAMPGILNLNKMKECPHSDMNDPYEGIDNSNEIKRHQFLSSSTPVIFEPPNANDSILQSPIITEDTDSAKRPKFLGLPQDNYIAMHSASTKPSPQFEFNIPLIEDPQQQYVHMRSAVGMEHDCTMMTNVSTSESTQKSSDKLTSKECAIQEPAEYVLIQREDSF